ncbi:DUF559 domain-containing protein [Catellatospora chokoriensis]|uniref:Restriction endonuclease type II-like domain-containing protein n=1 Tax=Catellatospora chokoriensis TaxID=310353 RepID=A0A8J3K4M9_9ACTN|nr:hypothetical protein Cch02nite_18330 [Catellatospora chokoriensis]
MSALRTAYGRGDLSRPWRGVYALDTDEISRVQALFALLPEGARLSGPTAAAWYGFGVSPSPLIHVTVPQGSPHPRLTGVRSGESVLPLPTPVLLHGVPALPPERVAVTLARTVRRIDALPILDAALRAEAVSLEALHAELITHGGLPGVCQARELVPLADARAECRQESQLRLVVIDGGLPHPEPQLQVGYFRLDLGYEELKVGIEYDGSSHLTRDRIRHDRHRGNWLATRGWRMRHFTDTDLYRHPTRILTTLHPLLTPP